MSNEKQDSPKTVPPHVMFDLIIKSAIQDFHKDMEAQEMADILLINASKLVA